MFLDCRLSVISRCPGPAAPPAPAGIGPEIADAVQKIFSAAEAPIAWDVQEIGKEVDPRTNSFVTRENLDSVLVRGRGRGSSARSARFRGAAALRAPRACRAAQHGRCLELAAPVGAQRRPLTAGSA